MIVRASCPQTGTNLREALVPAPAFSSQDSTPSQETAGGFSLCLGFARHIGRLTEARSRNRNERTNGFE